MYCILGERRRETGEQEEVDDEDRHHHHRCVVYVVLSAWHGIYRSKLLGSAVVVAAASAAAVGSSPARVITSIDFSGRKRVSRASEREGIGRACERDMIGWGERGERMLLRKRARFCRVLKCVCVYAYIMCIPPTTLLHVVLLPLAHPAAVAVAALGDNPMYYIICVRV